MEAVGMDGDVDPSNLKSLKVSGINSESVGTLIHEEKKECDLDVSLITLESCGSKEGNITSMDKGIKHGEEEASAGVVVEVEEVNGENSVKEFLHLDEPNSTGEEHQTREEQQQQQTGQQRDEGEEENEDAVDAESDNHADDKTTCTTSSESLSSGILLQEQHLDKKPESEKNKQQNNQNQEEVESESVDLKDLTHKEQHQQEEEPCQRESSPTDVDGFDDKIAEISVGEEFQQMDNALQQAVSNFAVGADNDGKLCVQMTNNVRRFYLALTNIFGPKNYTGVLKDDSTEEVNNTTVTRGNENEKASVLEHKEWYARYYANRHFCVPGLEQKSNSSDPTRSTSDQAFPLIPMAAARLLWEEVSSLSQLPAPAQVSFDSILEMLSVDLSMLDITSIGDNDDVPNGTSGINVSSDEAVETDMMEHYNSDFIRIPNDQCWRYGNAFEKYGNLLCRSKTDHDCSTSINLLMVRACQKALQWKEDEGCILYKASTEETSSGKLECYQYALQCLPFHMLRTAASSSTSVEMLNRCGKLMLNSPKYLQHRLFGNGATGNRGSGLGSSSVLDVVDAHVKDVEMWFHLWCSCLEKDGEEPVAKIDTNWMRASHDESPEGDASLSKHTMAVTNGYNNVIAILEDFLNTIASETDEQMTPVAGETRERKLRMASLSAFILGQSLSQMHVLEEKLLGRWQNQESSAVESILSFYKRAMEWNRTWTTVAITCGDSSDSLDYDKYIVKDMEKKIHMGGVYRVQMLSHMGRYLEHCHDESNAARCYGEAFVICKYPLTWLDKHRCSPAEILAECQLDDIDTNNDIFENMDEFNSDGADASNLTKTKLRWQNMSHLLHKLGESCANYGEFSNSVICFKSASAIRKDLLMDGDENNVEEIATEEVGPLDWEKWMVPRWPHDECASLPHFEHGATYEWWILPFSRKNPLSTPSTFTKKAREVDLADTLEWLAVSYREQGQADLSLGCFRDCLMVRLLAYGKNHVNVASVHHNLGIVYDDLGKHDASEEHYKESVRIRRHVAAGLNSALKESGDNQEARIVSSKQLAEANQQREKKFANDVALANSLVCLGSIYMRVLQLKKRGEALDCFLEAIHLVEQTFDLDYVAGEMDDARVLGGMAVPTLAAVESAADKEKQQGKVSAKDGSASTDKKSNGKEIKTRLVGSPTDEGAQRDKLLKYYTDVLELLCVDVKSTSELSFPTYAYQKSVCGHRHQLNHNGQQNHQKPQEQVERRTQDELLRITTTVLHGMGMTFVQLNRYDEALLVVRRQLSLFHSMWTNMTPDTEAKDSLEADYEQSLYLMGHLLFQLRQYDKALLCYQDVLGAWKSIGSSSDVSRALHNKGNCHRELGEAEKALACYKDSLQVRDQFARGDVSTAGDATDEAVSVRQEPPVNHSRGKSNTVVERANTCYQLGHVHLIQNNCAEAAELFRSSYDVFLAELGVHHWSVALASRALGEVRHMKGKYDEAMKWYRETIHVCQPLKSCGQGGSVSIGVGHGEKLKPMPLSPDVGRYIGDVYHDLGVIYEERGEMESAATHYAEALQMYRSTIAQAQGENGNGNGMMLCLGPTLCNMANVHAYRKKYDEALVVLYEALNIRREFLGEDDEDVARVWHALGVVHDKNRAAGGLPRAVTCYKEALRIREWNASSGGTCNEEPNADMATTLNNLGIVHNALHQNDEAIVCLERALAMRREVFGEQHEDTASTYHNLANVRARSGDNKTALALYYCAFKIRSAKYGEDHPSVASTCHNVANIYAQMGDCKESKKWYGRALASREKSSRSSSGNSGLATTLHRLAVQEMLTGEYDVALEHFKSALDMKRTHYQDQPHKAGGVDVAEILNGIARICILCKSDYKYAYACSVESEQILKTYQANPSGGDSEGSSLELAKARTILGDIYGSIRGSYCNYPKAIECYEGALTSLQQMEETAQMNGVVYQQHQRSTISILCSLGACYARGFDENHRDMHVKRSPENVEKVFGYLNKAIAAYQEELRLAEDQHTQPQLTADRKHLARALYHKGLLFAQSSNFECTEEDQKAALECFEESLDLYRDAVDEQNAVDAASKADALQKVGLMLANLREYERATDCFDEALQLREDARKRLQSERERATSTASTPSFDGGEQEWEDDGREEDEIEKEIAEIYHGMGIIVCERRENRDYDESLRYYRQALEIRYQRLGRQHPDVAQTLNNMGSVYARKNRMEDAMEYWKKALITYRAMGLGEENEKVKCTIANMDLAEKLIIPTKRLKGKKKKKF